MATPATPRRNWLRFSLRGMLILMALVGVVFGIWAWPWEEDLPQDRFSPGEDEITRIVMTYRRDLYWRKKTVGPFRAYDAAGNKRAEGFLDDQGARYGRTFDPAGRLKTEMHRDMGVRITRKFDPNGGLTLLEGRDAQHRHQGAYYRRNAEGETVEGAFVDDRVTGDWIATTPQRGDSGGQFIRRWRDGKRHGVWICPPVDRNSSPTEVEYRDDELIRCEGKRLPTQEFQTWLENELKIVRPVNKPEYPRVAPFSVEGQSLGYLLVQLSDGVERWVEIGFPCGQPEELRFFWYHHHGALDEFHIYDHAGTFPARYNVAILLEAAVRFDLVIDAVDGRLMITPRGEWCSDIFRCTGIQHVDFTAYPELAAAWQQEVRVNGEDQSDPLNAIRKMIADTPLKVDLSAVEPLGNWRPAIYGFGVPDGSIREQLRDVLFCSGLKCEQRGDTIVILPRWTLDRKANYPQ